MQIGRKESYDEGLPGLQRFFSCNLPSAGKWASEPSPVQEMQAQASRKAWVEENIKGAWWQVNSEKSWKREKKGRTAQKDGRVPGEISLLFPRRKSQVSYRRQALIYIQGALWNYWGRQTQAQSPSSHPNSSSRRLPPNWELLLNIPIIIGCLWKIPSGNKQKYLLLINGKKLLM